uniref:Uncharacterized protein n=1 Tax=Panagrellus redivivus TaxID=6233 RepID=A0A7E4V133_PANRE
MLLIKNWLQHLILWIVFTKTIANFGNETLITDLSGDQNSKAFADSRCVVISVSPKLSATVLTVAQSQETIPSRIKQDLIDTETSWECRKHVDDPDVIDLCCASESAISDYTPTVKALTSLGPVRIPQLNDFLKDWNKDARQNREIIKYLIVGAIMAAISLTFFLIMLCTFNPCCKCCQIRPSADTFAQSPPSPITAASSTNGFGPPHDVIKSNQERSESRKTGEA